MTERRISCSVALCTCNGERYLSEQLASIARQTIFPSELVICDDDSEDSTYRIAEEFAKSAPFQVRLYKNASRLGVTKNFEQALDLCAGKVIFLADQDDIWVTHKLERLLREFASSPSVGMVFSEAERVDETLRLLPGGLWDTVRFTVGERRMARQGRMLDVLLRHATVTGATMAIRADLRDIVLPIPETWMHDAWIALLIASCSDVVVIDEPLIKYRQHASNQIGARRKGLSERLRETQGLQRTIYYGDELQRYRTAFLRANSFSGQLCHADVLSMMAGKLAHLEVRGRLSSSNRWLRIPSILRELLLLNYYRYSYGWQVAVRDFLLPGESV